MTPKEKAADMYYRFWDEAPHYAKQCAMIAVEEIIKTFYLPITDSAKEYWQQVKTEIENL